MRWSTVFFILIFAPLPIGAVLVGLELWGIEIPLSSSWREICLDCRSHRYHRVLLGVLHRTESEDTAYTRWFERRVGQPHEHRFATTGCRTISTLFGATYICYFSEPQTLDPGGFAEILDALLPHGQDLEFHRSLASEDPERRQAAGGAGRRRLRDLREGGSDLSAWWEAARRFLDDPAAWGIGFGTYVDVVLPSAR